MTPAKWATFGVRPAIRIMPAFLAMLALVLLYLTFLYRRYTVYPPPLGWFNNWYATPTTAGDVLSGDYNHLASHEGPFDGHMRAR